MSVHAQDCMCDECHAKRVKDYHEQVVEFMEEGLNIAAAALHRGKGVQRVEYKITDDVKHVEADTTRVPNTLREMVEES